MGPNEDDDYVYPEDRYAEPDHSLEDATRGTPFDPELLEHDTVEGVTE